MEKIRKKTAGGKVVAYAFLGGLIVSCQAEEEEPLHGSIHMQKMALAAQMSGAKGIRANSPEDVRAIKEVVSLPVIGIFKDRNPTYDAFITTTRAQVDLLAKSGADLLALDCTRVSRPEPLPVLFEHIRRHYPSLRIVADIADLKDVRTVLPLRPDFFSTTLSGYTSYSQDAPKPDLRLVAEIHRTTNIPVLAEGNYQTPQQVRQARLNGAYSVVVGGAITRPQQITKRFARALGDLQQDPLLAVGVDVGGTWIRGVRVDQCGHVFAHEKVATPTDAEERVDTLVQLIRSLQKGVAQHVGVATAGRTDRKSGRVLFASENLPGWTGMDLRNRLQQRISVVPTVENDASMAAFAQWKESGESSLFLVTLGTGIGGGFVWNGQVWNGFQGGGGEVGHVHFPGLQASCTCGKQGCLETVASGKAICAKAAEQNPGLLEEWAGYLGWLMDTVQMILDPEVIFLGGVAEKYGSAFLDAVRQQALSHNPQINPEKIRLSTVGEWAGAVGAARFALEYPPHLLLDSADVDQNGGKDR